MLKIIGLGDNVVDRYLYKNKMYPGGNAVNVPVLAHKTGKAEAAYIGCLGNDYAGTHIYTSLQAEGIDVSHVRILEGSTAYADVTLVDSDRVFLGGSCGVSHDIVLTEDDKEFIHRFDLIHTSIYSGLDAKMPEIKSIGPMVSYDYSNKLVYDKSTLPFVDFAIFSGGATPVDELQQFMRTAAVYGPAQILMTMGSHGSMLYKDGKFYMQNIYPIESIVDTMGAGDSFIARYLAGMFDGETTEESLSGAAEFAAKNCLLCGTFGYETDIR